MKHSTASSCRGQSNQGVLLWIAVLGIGAFIVKGELFPSVKGSSRSELVARLGQPLSKSVVPRPR